MTPAQRPTRVLSIVGPGRSGTTVLGNILGEVPGIFDGGELRWVWQRGVIERRLCGCGQVWTDCPVWSRAVPRVLGVQPGPQADDTIRQCAAELVREQARISARRNRRRLIEASTSAAVSWAPFQRLRDTTVTLCATLADITAARVVVDTSKRAQDAALLAGSEGIEHYVVQMVRDPRAVAHSWRRAKARPTAAGIVPMDTRSFPSSLVRWAENCLGAEGLRRRVARDRWLFVRYEDFARQPRSTVQGILDFLGHQGELPFEGEDTVLLNTNHTVAGNPDRFRTGPVRIIADEEWRSRMPRREQAFAAAATLPLLRRYGYPLLPAASGSRSR